MAGGSCSSGPIFGFALTSFLMAFAQDVYSSFSSPHSGRSRRLYRCHSGHCRYDHPREHIGYAMGVLQTSLTTGGIIGPFLGGSWLTRSATAIFSSSPAGLAF